MFIDSHKLNKSDIFSDNNIFYNENKQYFNTTIKKKKNNKFSYSNSPKLLLNTLKDFSVKYDLEDLNMIKSQKFVISFDELISIIRYTLEAQIKLYNILKDESDNTKNITQEFINNLNYFFYSYEKVEQINPGAKKSNNKSISDKENININLNNGKNKSLIKIMNKSQSYWIDERKNGNNQNKKMEKYKEEKIVQENIKLKNNNSNNFIQTSKSYYKRNKGSKLFSPNKNKIKEKFIDNEEKRKNRKSIREGKSHLPINTDFSQNNKDNITKKKFNKSTEKRKSVKIIKKKNENKSLSIYTACEHLKSSSFIFKKNKPRELTSTEKCDINDLKKNNNNYDSNNNVNKKKESKKIMYYNQNMMLGVKKQIITNNVPKPSNLANKFLQNGRKFITEFNGIKEEERKKQYYS